MMRRRCVLFLCICLMDAGQAAAQRLLPNGLHEPMTAGVELILRQEYLQAESLFVRLAAVYPAHPAGPVMCAAVLQSRSLDLNIPLDRARFDSLLSDARTRIEAMRSAETDPVWTLYFDATADGYDAVARVDEGDWLGGIRKGIASSGKFEELVENDSSFADAMVGIGTYLYWRSRKTEFLHWLPFVSDDRSRGIELLVRGAREGTYNRFAAMSALIAIFLDAGDFRNAEQWSLEALHSYPQNRVFLWGRATALDRQGRCSEAAEAYSLLLRSILTARSPVPYDEIVCRLNFAKCRLAVGDTAGVSEHLRAIGNYESLVFPASLAERAQEKFTEARRLLARSSDSPPTAR